MIKMFSEKFVHCPIFTCDTCGERIEEASKGRVLYGDDETGSSLRPELYFVHFGKCDFKWGKGLSREWRYSCSIAEFLLQLGQNTGFDDKVKNDAQDRVDLVNLLTGSAGTAEYRSGNKAE